MAELDRVLSTPVQSTVQLKLISKRWHRKSMAIMEPTRFKVLVELKGIPARTWSIRMAQQVLATSYAGHEPTQVTVKKKALNKFVVVAWCIHPDSSPTRRSLLHRRHTGIMPFPMDGGTHAFRAANPALSVQVLYVG